MPFTAILILKAMGIKMTKGKFGIILALIIVLGLTFNVEAQDKKPISNSDVIEMSKAGLAPAVIISKIRTSRGSFDTELEALKALTDAGVSDQVIAAMIDHQSAEEKPKAEIKYSEVDSELGSFDEIRGKTRVFLVIPDLDARKIVVEGLGKIKGLQIVQSREEADFAMMYVSERVDMGSNAFLNTNTNVVFVGELRVYTYLPPRPGEENGRVRYVWQTRKRQDWSGGLSFNRHPAKNAINEFASSFKKLNR